MTQLSSHETTCYAIFSDMEKITNLSYDDINHIDIATKLLNSNDTKVVAAAKRIFTPVVPPSSVNQKELFRETKTIEDITMTASDTGVSLTVVPKLSISTSILVPPYNRSCPMSGTIPLGNNISEMIHSSVDSMATNSMVNVSALNNPGRAFREQEESSKKQTTSHERLKRSRERNKIHARRTRQRKKEHMQDLEKKAKILKQTQISLKLLTNEKNTANILIAMFSTEVSLEPKSTTTDLRIEELLKRSTEDIPDVSQIPEMPALVLPGHHNNRKRDFILNYKDIVTDGQKLPDDGIDYDLLAKDRSKCTSTELDKIRRERNRMHAKRTRDRKKRFMDEMSIIIKQLEDENELLSDHLRILSEKHAPSSGVATPSLMLCPKLESHTLTIATPPVFLSEINHVNYKSEKSSTITLSDTVTVSDDGIHRDLLEMSPQKRQRANDGCVPTSITTTTNLAHGRC